MRNSVASCPYAHSSLRADTPPVRGLRTDSCVAKKSKRTIKRQEAV